MMPMTPAAFIARYAELFEHSPWIAERAAAHLGGQADDHALMMQVVADATPDEQLALIRAHPELAGREALAKALTADSSAEQASVGLDRLSVAEYAELAALNAAYRAKFSFPFIICVRRTDKAGIFSAMRARLAQDRDREIATALAEIGKITRIRMEAMA